MGQTEKRSLGVLMPSIHIGGGENATLYAIQCSDYNLVEWKLVLVTSHYVTWEYLYEYAQIVPVYFEGFYYFKQRKTPMTLQKAVEILCACDGVIAWELDDERSEIFNNVLGTKIHWIFRHDKKHRKQVKEDHVLLTCSAACIPDFGSIGNRQVFIIPSHVDFEHCKGTRSRDEIRMQWDVGDKTVVGYLGRMDKNKNIPAIARTVAGRKDMIAICYGVRTLESVQIEDEIYRIADNNIRWYDAVVQVGDFFAGIDVLILPSYSEVFSLTLLEAWAMKVPVVCTNVGEVPVLQAKYGKICSLITPEDSGEKIRRKIYQALDDRATVERAYQMVIENYTTEIIAAKWNDFFKKNVKIRK